MRIAVLLARLALGIPLVVFGLNGFLHFMEPPSEAPIAGAAFLRALAQSGYVMPLVAGVQLLSGALILTGCCVPLGLVLFAPVLVNIVGYHFALDPAPAHSAMGWLLLAAELFLAFAYARSFRCLFELAPKSRFHPG